MIQFQHYVSPSFQTYIRWTFQFCSDILSQFLRCTKWRVGEEGENLAVMLLRRRREKRDREAGIPGCRKAGQIGENLATAHDILQQKRHKDIGATKKEQELGVKDVESGKREVQASLSQLRS